MKGLRYIFKNYRRRIATLLGHKYKIKLLRSEGMRIGKNCKVYTMAFGNEPYLIELGDDVSIGTGTRFTNHDGGVSIFNNEFPKLRVYGKIKVGNNTFIGVNCIILLDTEIGDNCIIAAGSVVKGKIPDNSVVMGNPAKVVMNTGIFKMLAINNKNRIDTADLPEKVKRKMVMDHFNKNEN